MSDERFTGTLKWFSAQKGYGFIEREGGKDLFVHYSAFQRLGGPVGPAKGDRVEFSIEQGPKGPAATNVLII
jgi:CspA family cold shock protein